MSGAAAALERVRATCPGLPETSERPSHGAPAFFIRGTRSFLTFHDDHHGDGRLAIWCAAVRLDRGIAWERVAEAIETAHLVRRPRAGSRRSGPTR